MNVAASLKNSVADVVVSAAEFEIPLDLIDVPENRARDLDEALVTVLGGLFARQGQINAITVRAVGERFQLVTGLHRRGAAQWAGWASIRARLSTAASDDEAKLEEVMENLGRNELKALDRCRHLYELKQVYERLHPEAKNGAQGGRAGQKNENEVFAFSIDAAEKVGLSRRSIEIAVAIWKGLSVASRSGLAGTWLAGHQSNLKLLSEQTPPLQKNVLEMLLAEKPKANNVQEALTIIQNGRTPTHVEKKFEVVNKTLSNLKDGELDAVIATNEDRLLSRLTRMEKGISTLNKIFLDMKDDELDQVVEANEARIIASLKRRGAL